MGQKPKAGLFAEEIGKLRNLKGLFYAVGNIRFWTTATKVVNMYAKQDEYTSFEFFKIYREGNPFRF